MSDNLVVAKTEYTQQLIESISPPIYRAILTIFEKCKGREEVYKCFQKKLCDIPLWNQNIISDEHQRIVKESKLEWLDILIEAIFICNIKILSSINSTPSTINIKIPESKAFIHDCYIQVARSYYMQPKIITQNSLKNIELIKNSIIKALLHAIPQKDVIESCLKQQIEDSNNVVPDTADNESEDTDNIENEEEDNNEDSKSLVTEDDIFMKPPNNDISQPTDLETQDDEVIQEDYQNNNEINTDRQNELKENEIEESNKMIENDELKYREKNMSDSINVDVLSGDNLEKSLDPPKKEDAFFFSDSDEEN
jgi:hypothetical protein